MLIEIEAGEIVILCGPSSTGKSCFAQRHFTNSQVLSSDFFRRMIADEEVVWRNDAPEDADISRVEAIRAFDYKQLSAEAFALLRAALVARAKQGRLTVIDATNLRLQEIRQYIVIAQEQHVPVSLVCFQVPIKTALANDEMRSNPRGAKHIQHQYRSFNALCKQSSTLMELGIRQWWEVKDPANVKVRMKPNPRIIELGCGLDVMGDGHGLLSARIELIEKAGYQVGEDGLYRHPEGRKLVYLNDETSRGSLPMKGILYGKYPSIAMMVMMMRHVEAGLAYAVDSNHNFKIWRWLEGRKVSMKHGDERVVEEFAAFEKEHGKKTTVELKSKLAQFLKALPSHYVIVQAGVERAVVTHAGIQDDMIGKEDAEIRDFCRFGPTNGVDETGRPIRLDWTINHENRRLIIWGHDPHPIPEVVLDTINIDQGGFAGNALTMLCYPEMNILQAKVGKSFVSAADDPLVRKHRTLRFQTPRLNRYIGGFDVQTSWGKVSVNRRLVQGAIEQISLRARPLEELFYVPPTMAPPTKTSRLPQYLEHPLEAFDDYIEQGVKQVVLEQKHMGSRAVIALFSSPEVGEQYIRRATRGLVSTRSNQAFFAPDVEKSIVDQLVRDLAPYFEEMQTDLLVLDAEVLPWNLKAVDLIRRQYGPVAKAALFGREQHLQLLQEYEAQRHLSLADETDRAKHLLQNAASFAEALNRFCSDVDSLHDVHIAPFHVLAFDHKTNMDETHVWHMEQATKLAALSDIIRETPYRVVDLANQKEIDEAVSWWETITAKGQEGLVVKPIDFLTSTNTGLIVQPALKVRGREYLRLVYGMDYLEPETLQQLKGRSVAKKMRNAHKEFILSMESLTRFIRMDSLERIHECVLAALSFEADPVDPRL